METKIKRLFIEIDNADEGEMTTWMYQVCLRHNLDLDTEEVFDKIISEAGLQPQDTFQAVVDHDEIYASTALYDNYTGVSSPTLFNSLMYHANKNGVKGKKLYILREFNNVQWENLKADLAKECFTNNQLFVLPDDWADGWREITLEELIEAIGE